MPDPIQEFLRRAAELRAQQLAEDDDEILDADVVEEDEFDADAVRPVGSSDAFAERVSHLGKRIVLSLQGDLHMVIHLMIAGRLRWKKPGAAVGFSVSVS